MTTVQPTYETTHAEQLICQAGSARQIGALAKSLSISHLLLVTDPGVISLNLHAGALSSLQAAGIRVTLYGEVQADPPQAIVEAALARARNAGIDGVLGFGGGSSLDTAKLVALLLGTPQRIDDIYGINLAQGPRLPLIQVPTTAGTGSECTPISILTTPTHEKKGVVSDWLLADTVVLDAELTLGLPPAITAMTGVDAIVHAIEAYTSKIKKNPASDALALRALQMLFSNLPQVLKKGDDVATREAMLLGASLAGQAFTKAPVAAVHALAYPIGGHFHVPHGLSNSLVLVPVLTFNEPAARPLYAQLGRHLLPNRADTNDEKCSTLFINAIEDLVRQMPYAQRLREVGIVEKDLPMLARDAMQIQRLLVNNPRELGYDDALAIYHAAF